MFERKKNKKQKDIYTDSYVVNDTDNIISIAQSYNISWKELAEVNNIEPPYILISGETIKVPGTEESIESKEMLQVTSDKDSRYIKKQMNPEGVSSDVVTASDIKSDKQAVQLSKEAIQQDTNSKTKKQVRKVTYASPKSMLHKPSAEPITRAVDIEWMQDDEEVYSEEIQLQRKKLNTRFIMLSLLIIAIIGFVVWRGVDWFLKKNDNKNISVQTLIEEGEKTKEVKQNTQEDGNKNNEKDDSEEMAMEGGKDLENEQDKKNDVEQKKSNVPVEDITVQVLNAGAQVGAAGDVTKAFAKSGYQTITARNAKNDYKGVVIYYRSDKKDNIDMVAKEVKKKYGTQKYE